MRVPDFLDDLQAPANNWTHVSLTGPPSSTDSVQQPSFWNIASEAPPFVRASQRNLNTISPISIRTQRNPASRITPSLERDTALYHDASLKVTPNLIPSSCPVMPAIQRSLTAPSVAAPRTNGLAYERVMFSESQSTSSASADTGLVSPRTKQIQETTWNPGSLGVEPCELAIANTRKPLSAVGLTFPQSPPVHKRPHAWSRSGKTTFLPHASSTESRIFVTSDGRPLGFFIPFGVYGRLELCRKIKAHGGVLKATLPECNYVLLTKTEVPMVQEEAHAWKKNMMATWWITACVIKHCLLPPRGYEFLPPVESHATHYEQDSSLARLDEPSELSSEEDELLVARLPNSRDVSRSFLEDVDHSPSQRESLISESRRTLPSSDSDEQEDGEVQYSSDEGGDDDSPESGHIQVYQVTAAQEDFERVVRYVAEHSSPSKEMITSRSFWTPCAKDTKHSEGSLLCYAQKWEVAIHAGAERLRQGLPIGHLQGGEPIDCSTGRGGTPMDSDADESDDDFDVPVTKEYGAEDFWNAVKFLAKFFGEDLDGIPTALVWREFQKLNPHHSVEGWVHYGRKWRYSLRNAIRQHRRRTGWTAAMKEGVKVMRFRRPAAVTEKDLKDVIDHLWTTQPARLTAGAVWAEFAKDHPVRNAKAWIKFVRRREHTKIRPALEERRRDTGWTGQGPGKDEAEVTRPGRLSATEQDFKDAIDYLWTTQPANLTAGAVWTEFAKDHPERSAIAWQRLVRYHEHTKIRPGLEERRRDTGWIGQEAEMERPPGPRSARNKQDLKEVIDYLWTTQPTRLTTAAVWAEFAKDHPVRSAAAWTEFARRYEHSNIRPALEERRKAREGKEDGLNENGKRHGEMELTEDTSPAKKKRKTHTDKSLAR